MQINEIDPTRTAMIVVDMQNDIVAAGAPMETPAARAMVPRLASLALSDISHRQRGAWRRKHAKNGAHHD